MNYIDKLKEFFGITEESYQFEIFDLTTVLTVLNVALIFAGVHWAPVLGIVNCIIILGLGIRTRAHINSYITQIALIALNFYFLG